MRRALGWTMEVHKGRSEHYKKLAKLAIAGAARAKPCSADKLSYYAAAMHDYAIYMTHANAWGVFGTRGDTAMSDAIQKIGDKLKACLRK